MVWLYSVVTQFEVMFWCYHDLFSLKCYAIYITKFDFPPKVDIKITIHFTYIIICHLVTFEPLLHCLLALSFHPTHLQAWLSRASLAKHLFIWFDVIFVFHSHWAIIPLGYPGKTSNPQRRYIFWWKWFPYEMIIKSTLFTIFGFYLFLGFIFDIGKGILAITGVSIEFFCNQRHHLHLVKARCI